MKAPPCETADTLAQLPAYLLAAELSGTAGTPGYTQGTTARSSPGLLQLPGCRVLLQPQPIPAPLALQSVCSVHLEPTEGIVENSQRIPVPAGEWVGWALGESCAAGTAEALGQCPGARSHRGWEEHPISQGNRPKPRRAGGLSLACQQPLSLLQGISVNVMRAARAQRQLQQSCYCQQAGAAWGQQSLIHYRMSCSSRGSGPAVPSQHRSSDPPAPRGTAPAQCPGTAIPQGRPQCSGHLQ